MSRMQRHNSRGHQWGMTVLELVIATAIMDQAYLMIGANIDDIRNYPSDDC